ncbi:MAG: chemotaxis protein CheW [Endozoicomonas sp. (ex Botrylloides leachii)]|nr:chemotaxis protein CheW [Endozoicomonas sp. (ex Botrylloides leachii)]
MPCHPFEQLAALEKRAKRTACFFPEQEAIKTFWNGVKFQLNDQSFVIDSREVSEIIPLPSIVPLPDVQPWITGIANLRGRIIPIIDLGAFLGRKMPSKSTQRRVMLVEQVTMTFGAIVDEVQGMIQFSHSSGEDDIPEDLALSVRPFITGCYYKNVHHMIFSTELLVNNQRFIKAAKQT